MHFFWLPPKLTRRCEMTISAFRTVSVAGLLLGASTLATLAGPLTDRIAAGETIRIGFANEIPFAYPGDDGSPKGFVNATVIGVLAGMGHTNIEVVQTEWGGLIPGLNAGQFDIITGGMNILSERCTNVAFSEPIAKIGDGFIVAPGHPKGISTYASVKDAGAILATGAGYSNIDAAKAACVVEDPLMIVPGPTEILAAVAAGRPDAGTGTYPTMKQLADASAGAVEVADPSAMPEDSFNWAGVGFRKEDQDFLDAYNAAQAAYLGTPEMLTAVAEYGYSEAMLPGDLTTVDVIGAAFAALARGGVVMPPILSMDLHHANGEVDVKTAYIPGFDGFAIKVSPGFFDNPKIGLPSLNGLMILFSATTGLVQSLFLDNGYLTDIRTAAAGAVAARHLAPDHVETAGVIGTGVQARLQMQAAHLVRPFRRVLVHGRDMAKARACAEDLGAMLGVTAEAVADPALLVREAQLVVTTTPARQPVIRADWLHPGLHITAMGSDQSGKTEIDPAALMLADAFVCDRVSQSEVSGELEAALAAGIWTKGRPAELGEVIIGARPGRKSPQDITICDLTGTGVQDTAIATHVRARHPHAGTIMRA
jgi:ectoine utilization protein EutC